MSSINRVDSLIQEVPPNFSGEKLNRLSRAVDNCHKEVKADWWSTWHVTGIIDQWKQSELVRLNVKKISVFPSWNLNNLKSFSQTEWQQLSDRLKERIDRQ